MPQTDEGLYLQRQVDTLNERMAMAEDSIRQIVLQQARWQGALSLGGVLFTLINLAIASKGKIW